MSEVRPPACAGMESRAEVVDWAWLGRVRFAPVAALQEAIRGEVIAGRSAGAVLFCEHHPVITLGRGARPEHVLFGEDDLARRGIEVVHASRGGDVTYHGPGQLVGYPILRLRRGVVAHVEGMARAVIEVLGSLGVTAAWRREQPGVWVGTDKICAFGIHVRHGVAIHGFALNATTPLAAFDTIVPCGLRSSGVTSIQRLVGHAPEPAALARAVAAATARVFSLSLRERTADGDGDHGVNDDPNRDDVWRRYGAAAKSGGFSIAKSEIRSLE
jgi:lipoyl(octanoyl) transferase